MTDPKKPSSSEGDEDINYNDPEELARLVLDVIIARRGVVTAQQSAATALTAIASNAEAVLAMRQVLAKETDRGCVLVAAAYLDEQLGTLFRARTLDEGKVTDSLFENNGPLGSFSSRIALARSLGMLPKDTCADLQLIRRIRNEFAHISKDMSFKIPAIRDRCTNLTGAVQLAEGNARWQFTSAVMMASSAIEAATRSAQRPKEPPQTGDPNLDEIWSKAFELVKDKIRKFDEDANEDPPSQG